MRQVATDQNLPFKKLDPLDLDLKIVTQTIPKSFAMTHLLLPFEIKNGILAVALYDPAKQSLLQDIERANQVTVKPYLSTKSNINKIQAEFFGFQTSITAAESSLAAPTVDIENLEQYVQISSAKELLSTDQHIKGAVDHLFNYAFDQRASDIHIEPKRDKCHIRLRIDGILHTIYKLPKAVHSAIISRIKSLSRLDIAEKRRPQDGRIKIDRSGAEAEIRVSTIPVAFGEKVVLRILDPGVLFQDLKGIGFSDRDYHIYENLITSSHGILLVTGPTGSGKSTTLYSTLKYISNPGINITTVEDPVEMIHEEFNQISVQAAVDVTFSTILRNILRQDPDVIMIGEIRDLQTASNAIQAALTGHLVLSTLHTNDSVSSISRLIDLGVQPFLIASTLLGVQAQRLVRKICPFCSETYNEPAEILRGFGFPAQGDKDIRLQKGKGCQKCRSTGYLGRCGVFEIFPMSEPIKKLTTEKSADSELRNTAIREGMTPLKQDAWHKVLKGITTVEDAIRVTGSLE
jgi:general secretion pathway protein E